ncbi:hypothetical protein O1L68_38530 [Streptomyces lydicus]|nr:hypothetical protein [Streptomyces lydicus]
MTADVLGAPTTLRLPGLADSYVEVGAGEAKFDLSFGMVDTDAPAGIVQYSRSALDEEAAAALGTHYAALLTAVADDPGLRLSRLPGGPPAPGRNRRAPGRGAAAFAPRGGRGRRGRTGRRPAAGLCRTARHRRPHPAELRSRLRAELAPAWCPPR